MIVEINFMNRHKVVRSYNRLMLTVFKKLDVFTRLYLQMREFLRSVFDRCFTEFPMLYYTSYLPISDNIPSD